MIKVKTDPMGNPTKREGTYGIYALAEQIVFREIQDREQNLTLFGRIGFADPRVNRFSQYYGGGFVYRGLFPSREDDEFGFGVAAALNGNHFERAQNNRGNTVDDSENIIGNDLFRQYSPGNDCPTRPPIYYES